VPEDEMARALKFAHHHCGAVITAQRQLAEAVGKAKRPVEPTLLLPPPDMMQRAEEIGVRKNMEERGGERRQEGGGGGR